jgi:response regulator RpfG family c-di-GMP phosphodiesterase
MNLTEAAEAARYIVQRFATPLVHLADVITAAEESENRRGALAREIATLTAERDRLVTERADAEQAHTAKLAKMDAAATERRQTEEQAHTQRVARLTQDIADLEALTVTARREADDAVAASAEAVRAAGTRAEAALKSSVEIEDTLAQLKTRIGA